MTDEQAAAALGVTPRTVRAHVRRSGIPHTTVGRRMVVAVDALMVPARPTDDAGELLRRVGLEVVR